MNHDNCTVHYFCIIQSRLRIHLSDFIQMFHFHSALDNFEYCLVNLTILPLALIQTCVCMEYIHLHWLNSSSQNKLSTRLILKKKKYKNRKQYWTLKVRSPNWEINLENIQNWEDRCYKTFLTYFLTTFVQSAPSPPHIVLLMQGHIIQSQLLCLTQEPLSH